LRIDTVVQSVDSAVRGLRDYLAGAGVLAAARDPARAHGMAVHRAGGPFPLQSRKSPGT
jgi:hypothetical protein